MQGIFRALVWPLRAAQLNQKKCVLLILKYTPEIYYIRKQQLLTRGSTTGTRPLAKLATYSSAGPTIHMGGYCNIALKWVQAVRMNSARISADNEILVPARSTAYTAYTCEPEQQQVDHFIAVLQERRLMRLNVLQERRLMIKSVHEIVFYYVEEDPQKLLQNED